MARLASRPNLLFVLLTFGVSHPQMQQKLKELECKLSDEESTVKKLEAGGKKDAEDKKRLQEVRNCWNNCEWSTWLMVKKTL